MKTTRYLLVFFTLLLSIILVQAKSKVLLRLNLQKGTTYEHTVTTTNQIEQETMGQKINIDLKVETASLCQVLDVLPSKNFLIEYSIEKVKMDMSMNGQKMSFNSESTDSINPMNSAFKGFIANKLKFELTPKGSIERIEGIEEYAKKFSENPQLAQAMPMFASEESFKSFFGQWFGYFPENNVSKGAKWANSLKLPALMNMATILNFEVADITKDLITLNVISDVNIDTLMEQMGMKMSMKGTGTQNGNMIIDLDDGWLRTYELDQKFNMNMKMKNPQNGEDLEIPMSINGKTTITVVKK